MNYYIKLILNVNQYGISIDLRNFKNIFDTYINIIQYGVLGFSCTLKIFDNSSTTVSYL